MSVSQHAVLASADDQVGERAVDLVFAVSGTRLPAGYAAALWEALVGRLPWLADEPGVGVHAIRSPSDSASLLLSRRARLALRLPLRRQADAMRLAGQHLDVDGEALEVGAARPRALEPYPTLSARFVATGAVDELSHQQAVAAMLAAIGMPLRFICGRMHTVRTGGATVSGAEVVMHQLRPEQSLAMQQHGLGGERHLGHGLFVPHKTISDID